MTRTKSIISSKPGIDVYLSKYPLKQAKGALPIFKLLKIGVGRKVALISEKIKEKKISRNSARKLVCLSLSDTNSVVSISSPSLHGE